MSHFTFSANNRKGIAGVGETGSGGELFKSPKLPCEGFRLPIWFIAGGVSIAAAAMQPDRWAIKIRFNLFLASRPRIASENQRTTIIIRYFQGEARIFQEGKSETFTRFQKKLQVLRFLTTPPFSSARLDKVPRIVVQSPLIRLVIRRRQWLRI
jgi:hypothetical protein